MACRGGHQSQPQTKRCYEALTPAKLRLCPTGVQQGLRKHPLELVSNHAKLSVIHLGLLSLSLQQHTQEEFRMDRKKNLQQNQILKSSYLCAGQRDGKRPCIWSPIWTPPRRHVACTQSDCG